MNKKYLIIIGLIIGLLIANVIIHAQVTVVAVVIQVKGEATLYRIDRDESVTVERGTRLQTGDRLITGSDTHVAIRFIDDASLVRISSNSTCVIEGTRENNEILKNVYLEAGTILSKITDQKGQYKVITPTSVASVKGTEFITAHSNNPGTYYYGNEGEVEISNDAGTVLLRVGFTVYVASENTPPVISETMEGQKPAFDEELEAEDEFEFEFENQSGEIRTLRFRAIQQEQSPDTSPAR